MPTALLARGVTVHRDGATLLQGVDLEVRTGERWALLGGNGAGKTTLLQLLGARRFPSEGVVEVLGARLGRVAVHDLWREIGQVHSGHLPSGRLTARQVVLTGEAGTAALPLRWQPSSELQARVAGLVGQLGLESVADHPWPTLSAGERGRVLLARALVPDPRLLLLDEPSTALDLPARERLVDALDALAQERPERAGVLVTHHLEELPPSTTHAALLRRGRLLAAGPVEQVLTSAALSACFDLPLSVRREDGRWSARGVRPTQVGRTPTPDERQASVSSPGQSTDAQPPQDDQPQDGSPQGGGQPSGGSGAPYDARSGSGDPRTDPAAAGEVSAAEPDADGGATPHDTTVPEPGTG